MLKSSARKAIRRCTIGTAVALVGALVAHSAAARTGGEEYPALAGETAPSFSELARSAYVVEGTAKAPKSLLYIFVDANCPYCHLTWKALQPYEKAGLQVRWIPVAVLRPSSMPKAIDVLSADDRTMAFRKMEESSGKPWSLPSHLSSSDKARIAENVRSNAALMEALGIFGTPGIVWKDAAGAIRVRAGMPPLHEFPEMIGLPAQPVTDAELAKFE